MMDALAVESPESETAPRIETILEAVQSYLPDADLDLIRRAYVYSAKVHAGQTRKSGEPYLHHPLEVALLLTRLRLDEASVVTGLLHDTVEDTLATLEEVESLFGTEIATLVDGVTKLSQIRFDSHEHKQAENFRKMLVAMAKDIRVIVVKLTDRLHNMRTLEHLRREKQQRIAQETLDIYAPLANRLGIHWVKSELEDRAFQFIHPEDYQELDGRVRSMVDERDAYVQEVITQLTDELGEVGIEAKVYGRPKHLYSIFKKMTSRQIAFEDVYDVVAFRTIVANVSKCYEALGHVHALWRPIPGRFKDYVAMPKPNNYQSLHTSVIGPRAERIEIQIRTREMHQVAELGIAAHWEYKEGGPNRGQHSFAWLRQLLEWQRDLDDPNEFLDTVKYDLFTDEVFVFTPRGEVISLKRGATPVDFAFSIHTEVGARCAGAKVNGRMVPLRHELKNGDMVEIITHADQKPSKDWLTFVKTGRAKSKIRHYVRTTERERSRELGKEMLERELRRYGKSLSKLSKGIELDDIIATGKYGTLDGLYVALGYGRATPQQISEKLFRGEEPKKEAKAPPRPVSRKPRRSTGGVLVEGINDVLVRFAKCCNPLPGDPITGFITRGRGITVHTTRCTRAIDSDPERRIDVTWDNQTEAPRPVSVRVVSTDQPGILAKISQVFTDNGVNISQANCRVTSANRAINTFEVLIQNTEQLGQILHQVRPIKGVVSVERL